MTDPPFERWVGWLNTSPRAHPSLGFQGNQFEQIQKYFKIRPEILSGPRILEPSFAVREDIPVQQQTMTLEQL